MNENNERHFSPEELDPRTPREAEEFCDECGDVVNDHLPHCPLRIEGVTRGERGELRYTSAEDSSKWTIIHECPPIPTRAMDWQWVSDEYGGPGDDSHGNCADVQACVDAIEEWIEENACPSE